MGNEPLGRLYIPRWDDYGEPYYIEEDGTGPQLIATLAKEVTAFRNANRVPERILLTVPEYRQFLVTQYPISQGSRLPDHFRGIPITVVPLNPVVHLPTHVVAENLVTMMNFSCERPKPCKEQQ